MILNTNNIDNVIKIPVVKKIKLDNYSIVESSKISLYFKNINTTDYTFKNIILSNVKTKEEYRCPFVINNNLNFITLDFTNLLCFFTDYEASISILAKNKNTVYELIPTLPSNTIKNNNFISTKNDLISFIRILDNGELRLSGIINKKL